MSWKLILLGKCFFRHFVVTYLWHGFTVWHKDDVTLVCYLKIHKLLENVGYRINWDIKEKVDRMTFRCLKFVICITCCHERVSEYNVLYGEMFLNLWYYCSYLAVSDMKHLLLLCCACIKGPMWCRLAVLSTFQWCLFFSLWHASKM